MTLDSPLVLSYERSMEKQRENDQGKRIQIENTDNSRQASVGKFSIFRFSLYSLSRLRLVLFAKDMTTKRTLNTKTTKEIQITNKRQTNERSFRISCSSFVWSFVFVICVFSFSSHVRVPGIARQGH